VSAGQALAAHLSHEAAARAGGQAARAGRAGRRESVSVCRRHGSSTTDSEWLSAGPERPGPM
jgi:hypothetical protein